MQSTPAARIVQPATTATPPTPIGQTPLTGTGEGVTRGVLDWLVELAGALQKHATYPAGHPLLLSAVDRALGALPAAMQGRELLVVGLSPGQVLVGEQTTDVTNLLLRDLTLRMHRRDIAGLRVQPGLERDELLGLLDVVCARDDADEEEPVRVAWPHLRLVTHAYDRLELVDDAQPGEDALAAGAELWQRLTRAALDSDGDDHDDGVAGLAAAIAARARTGGDMQDLRGHFAALVHEAATGSAHAALVRRQLAELITSLDGGALRALVDDPAVQGSALTVEAVRALPPRAAARLIRERAAAAGRALAPAVLALLEKLATLADDGPPRVRGRAARALRGELRALGAAIDSADPEASLELLADSLFGLPDLRDASRLVSLGITLDVAAPGALRAADALVAAGDGAALLAEVTSSTASVEVREAFRARAVSAAALARMLAAPALDSAAAERLVDALGDGAAPPLVDALLETEERRRRYSMGWLLRRRFDAAVAELESRLPTAPRRQQLVLLHALRALGAGASPAVRRFARHPDAALRAPAVRLLLDRDGGGGIWLEALRSGDAHLARLALRAHRLPVSEAEIAAVCALVEDSSLPLVMRARAVAALAHAQADEVRAVLVRQVQPRRSLLRRARLADSTPLTQAVWRVLARRWSDDAEVRELLELARTSPDAALRGAVAAGLAAGVGR